MQKHTDILKTKNLYIENEYFHSTLKHVTENIFKIDIRVLLFYHRIAKIV